MPSDLKDWDKESCAALIAGLIDTDGCVQDHEKQHAGIIFYQSNKKLIKEVKNLLLKYKILINRTPYKLRVILNKVTIICIISQPGVNIHPCNHVHLFL